MKKTISILILLSVLLSLVSCLPVKNITAINNERDYDGVYITIDAIEGECFDRKLATTWHNDSKGVVTFGYGYSIEYNDGGVWKSCQFKDFAVIEIACILNPGEVAQMEYETKYFNLMRTGEYRLVVDCSIQLYDPSDLPGENPGKSESDDYDGSGILNPDVLDEMYTYFSLGNLYSYFTVG